MTKIAGTVKERLLDALKGGPLAMEELCEAANVGRDGAYVALSLMKKAGQVKSEREDGKAVYSLIDGAATRKPASKGRQAPPQPVAAPQGPASAPRPATDIVTVLQRIADQAQQAMDDYIASVVDQEILAHLTKARDSARAALACLE